MHMGLLHPALSALDTLIPSCVSQCPAVKTKGSCEINIGLRSFLLVLAVVQKPLLVQQQSLDENQIMLVHYVITTSFCKNGLQKIDEGYLSCLRLMFALQRETAEQQLGEESLLTYRYQNTFCIVLFRATSGFRRIATFAVKSK